MNPVIRLSRPTDINNLRDLDIKCYDYPLTMDQWQALVSASGKVEEARCVLVELQNPVGSNKPIGFGVWQKHEGDFLVLRIGVHKEYRRKGIGQLIVDTIQNDASKKGIKLITITVPDLHCTPGDPDDVSKFLLATGFRPSGKIIHNFKRMYGQDRDGYVFEMKIY